VSRLASPAKTMGGRPASWASTRLSASSSGHKGCWPAGRWRQDAACHPWAGCSGSRTSPVAMPTSVKPVRRVVGPGVPDLVSRHVPGTSRCDIAPTGRAGHTPWSLRARLGGRRARPPRRRARPPAHRRPRRDVRPTARRHVAAAAAARDELGLDRVLLVVANDPWQKSPSRSITPAEDRFALVEAAVSGLEGVEASRLELDRGGRATASTPSRR